MAIDPSRFHLYNIADACSVWNVLSSLTLYRSARAARVNFICTGFVLYECLFKPRTSKTDADCKLQVRLREAQTSGKDFQTFPLDVEDLQSLEVLEKRKRLGKGELSSIAFAMKTRQAFMTDDQKARKLGHQVLQDSPTQTTPHLLSWLIFERHLTDGDMSMILEEHQSLDRPLAKYFEAAYQEACRCRLLAHQGAHKV
jgi:hypothetical protein